MPSLEPRDFTSPIAPAAELLKGTAFGRVYPGPASPPFDTHDPRDHALRTLKQFIALLRFQRVGETPDGPPVTFHVPEDFIHVYQPDDVLEHGPKPGIGFLPGRATHESYGLGPPEVLDDTADRFGDGLVLVRRSDHVETVPVEIVAAKQPERVGILSGLKTALQMDDKSQALRLVCSSYFDTVASFRLDESENIDDAGATVNRRRAHLFVLLVIPEVTLVRYRRTLVIPEQIVERGPVEE